jgi:soluble lytic murein transglycosylase-like protein
MEMLLNPNLSDITGSIAQNDIRHLNAYSKDLHHTDAEKAVKAALDFEAMLIKQMLSQMTKSLDGEGFFGSQTGADFYNDMFVNEVSRSMAKNQSFGLAEQILRQVNPDAIALLNSNNSTNVGNTGITRTPTRPAQPQRAPSGPPLPKTLMGRLEQYESIIQRASEKYNIDPALIKAVITQESYANPRVVSSAGAKGLMQLMDGTARDLGVRNSFDPEQNIMGGTRYLRWMLDRYKGDLNLALAAYNAGPGNVDKFKGIPPFRETQNYVRRVQELVRNF